MIPRLWLFLAGLCCPDRALRRPTIDDLLSSSKEARPWDC